MAPGDYKLYTDVSIKGTHLVTAVENFEVKITLYPNPTYGQLHVDTNESIVDLQVRSVRGAMLTPYRVDDLTWDFSSFSPGLYIVEVRTERAISRKKLVVR